MSLYMWFKSVIQALLSLWRALFFYPVAPAVKQPAEVPEVEEPPVVETKEEGELSETESDKSVQPEEMKRGKADLTPPSEAPELLGTSNLRRRLVKSSSHEGVSECPKVPLDVCSHPLDLLEIPDLKPFDDEPLVNLTPALVEDDWTPRSSPQDITTPGSVKPEPQSPGSTSSGRLSLCWQDIKGQDIPSILAQFKAFKSAHPHWRGDRLLSEVITEKLKAINANTFSSRENSSNESVQKRRSGLDLSVSRLSLPSIDGSSDELIPFGQSSILESVSVGASLNRREALATSLFQLLESQGLQFNSDVTLFNVVVEACVGLGSMKHLSTLVKFLKSSSLKHLDSFPAAFMEDGSIHLTHEEIKRFLFGCVPEDGFPDDIECQSGQSCATTVLLDLKDPVRAARLREARRRYLMELLQQENNESQEIISPEINGVNVGDVFVPSLQSYGLLIRGFGHAKDLGNLRFLWNHATLYAGFEPESVTYGCMLDGLIQSGAVNEGMSLFEHMKYCNRVQPNTIMYSTLIKGFAKAKEHERALDLYNEMVENDVPINTVTFNSLVNACARVGAMRDAGFVLDKMLDAGISPDLVTFSTVVKGYCVRGEVERAHNLLISLKNKGIQPDGILYNTLLDGCVRAKKFALCEEVWNSMVADNVIPSNFTLTIFIKLFGRLGRLDRIFELVEEFPARYGFMVNGHVYTCLMSACISNQRFDRVYDIFQKMLESRDSAGYPDAKSFETALNGLLKGGFFREGCNVLQLAFGVSNELFGVETLSDEEATIGYRLDPHILRAWRDTMEKYHQTELLSPVRSHLDRVLKNAQLSPFYSQGGRGGGGPNRFNKKQRFQRDGWAPQWKSPPIMQTTMPLANRCIGVPKPSYLSADAEPFTPANITAGNGLGGPTIFSTTNTWTPGMETDGNWRS